MITASLRLGQKSISGVQGYLQLHLVSDYISYTNESGGTTTLSNTPLPASYSFKRTMKQGDNLTILASI